MNTDSTKKDPTEINCFSSDNTLLIKIDTVNVIRSQFDTFLEKFANHEKIYRDTKLPLFIVESFSRLFKHWREFPDLKKLIGRDVFEEIFKEMANVFEPKKLDGSSSKMSPGSRFHSTSKEEKILSYSKVISPPDRNPTCLSRSKLERPSSSKSESPSADRQNPPSTRSYLKLFCNSCNDDIQIVNDDLSLSYNLHIQSDEHLKCFDLPVAEPHISLPNIDNAEEAVSPSVIETTNSSVEPETLNSVVSSNSDDSEHLKTVNQFKLPTVDDPLCEPCCRIINSTELFIENHLKSKSHEKQIKLYAESKKILEKYGPYFSITNKETFEFHCHICLKKQTGTNCFIQHFRGAEHQANMAR